MEKSTRKLSLLSLIVLTGAAQYTALASEAPPPVPPQIQSLYQMLGSWNGQVRMTQPGQEPSTMKVSINCRKASSGFAVSCEDSFANGEMIMTETDLMGFNPVDGTSHWYSVTNSGEAHDHLVEWQNDNVLRASYVWHQDNTEMREDITLDLSKTGNMKMLTRVTAAGKEVVRLEGRMSK